MAMDGAWPWTVHGHGRSMAIDGPWPLTVHGHGRSMAMDGPWPWTVHGHGPSRGGVRQFGCPARLPDCQPPPDCLIRIFASSPHCNGTVLTVLPSSSQFSGKLDQPGKSPARNTSKSAPVVEKSSFGICFYHQGVRIIGVLALGRF